MKHIILFSGGLDSATLLYQLYKEWQENITPVFCNYGQKSYNKEKSAVERISKNLQFELIEVSLADVFIRSNSNLIADRTQKAEVEFRNGVMMAAAISLAMQMFPNERTTISFGAIQIREPFFDCSEEFAKRYNDLARAATNGMVSVEAPFMGKGKDEVLRIGKELGVPIKETWSCYEGGDKPCGKCLACIDRKILGVDK